MMEESERFIDWSAVRAILVELIFPMQQRLLRSGGRRAQGESF